MKMKKCTKCGAEKPATNEYFNVRRASRDGLEARCKDCIHAATKKYREKSKERIAASRSKKGGGVELRSLTCRRCGKKNIEKWIHDDDLEKLKDKFFCYDCKGLIDSDEDLFYGAAYNLKYTDDDISDMAYFDSVGGPLDFKNIDK